jgi:hypothetical protein
VADTLQERLVATLKKANPHKLRAFTSDDESRDVAIPGGRKKWSQVVHALDARPWSYVIMLDRHGAELGTVQNTSPAAELETFEATKVSGEHALAQRMTELALNTARQMLAFRDEETKALLKAQGDVVRELTSGMRALGELYREQAEVKAEVAADIAAKEAGGDGQIQQLMEALPVIVQALPMLKAMLAPAPSDAPSNGHNRKAHQ